MTKRRSDKTRLTTEERRKIRLSLMDLGFQRGVTTRDDGTGSYDETFHLGENIVTVQWGPKDRCNNVGPREATSPCVLGTQHGGDHQDIIGGRWAQ